MPKSIQELREQRNAAAKEIHNLVNKTEDWKPEHQEQYDKGVKDIADIDARIERAENALNLVKAEQNQIDRQAESQGVSTDEATNSRTKHKDIMNRWLRGGDTALNQQDWEFMNALSTTTDSEGGFTVPENFQARLLDVMKAFGGMREVAEVIQVGTGRSMNWPTTDSSTEEGEIVGQNQPRTEDDIITFGELVLDFFVYSSKSISVPRELLQDSGVDLEAHLVERLANRIWRIQNKHFTLGDGSGKPSGIINAAATGVSAANNAVEFSDLQKLIHSVDPVYRNNARFMFHDSTLLELKLKVDGDNRPLWLPGVGQGAPDTILGRSYVINQSMPVVGATNKSVAFGDLSKYLIADATGAEMFRFTDSAYTKKNQVGFLGMIRSGGGLTDVGGAVKVIEHQA